MKRLTMKKFKPSPEKDVKPVKYASIGLVIAPEIPSSEIPTLEKHYKEAMLDSFYTVVTNYEVRTDLFNFVPEREIASIVALGLPLEEVRLLRKKFDRAVKKSLRTKKPSYIFLNYEVRVDLNSRIPGNVVH
jgi:hypothetical protein